MSSNGIRSNALDDVLRYTAISLDMFNDRELLNIYGRVVDLMEHAAAIGVLGFRSSYLLAQYFENRLLPTPINVVNLTDNESFVFDRLLKLPKGSIIFALARWPYVARTIRVAEHEKSLGHDVILLTNHKDCEAKKFAKEVIITPRVEKCYSIVPFVVIMEAIINELYMRTSDYTLTQLNVINRTLEEQNSMIW